MLHSTLRYRNYSWADIKGARLAYLATGHNLGKATEPQEIKPSGRTHSLGSAVLFSRIFPTLTRNRGHLGPSGRSGALSGGLGHNSAALPVTHPSPSITGSSLARP